MKSARLGVVASDPIAAPGRAFLNEIMSKTDKKTQQSRLICSSCGSAQTIRRLKSRLRKDGHIKHLWCIVCNRTTPHHEKNKSKMVEKVILIRGLPGSGKTTLAKKLAEEHGLVHIENDQFFERDGKYEFVPALHKVAVADAIARFARALRNGNGVVVSNTFTRKWEIAPYLEISRLAGTKPEIIICDGDYGTIHDVSDETIANMKARWEP